MSLVEVPFEKRKLLAVDQAGALSENERTALGAAHQLKHQHNLNTVDGVLVAAATGIWASIADSRKKSRRKALGIVSVTQEEAGVFQYPDGHPKLGAVYAAHPYDHDTYYPLTDVHSYLLKAWVNDLADLLRSAGAGCLLIEAADTASQHELRVALGLPLVTESGIPLGQVDAGMSANWQRQANASYQWKRQGPTPVARTVNPLAHPLVATEPLILDMVRTLVDGTMAEAAATVETSRDFGLTPELVAKVEGQGFKVGGAFRRHTSSRLVVRVARDPEGFALGQ